jgi:hypothetical protein
MDMAGFPLREVILGLLVVAAIYIAVMLLRLSHVRKRKPPAAEPARRREAPVFEAGAARAPDEAGDEEEPAFTYARPTPAPVRPAPPPADNVHDFSAELSRSNLEREVRQLRDEIAALRGELEEVKAAHRVSPQYADAMALVQRGLTAQDVADRCGISLAEAELVWSLARGPQQFEEEDDHGIDSGRARARTA